MPSTSGCPYGNNLCNVLSSLSSCEVSVITQACICIGVQPKTTLVNVPKTTTTPSTKATSTSAANNPTSASSAWTTLPSSQSAGSPTSNTCSASTVTVTVTPSICLPSILPTASAAPCNPQCIDGQQAVCPPPANLICQQNGTLSPTNWDIINDNSAISVNDCANQCSHAQNGCSVSEYDYETQDCQIFNGGDAVELGFVAVPESLFIVSDVGCFVRC